MAQEYGILKSSTNTGNNGELVATFSAPLNIKSNKPIFASETMTLKRKTLKSEAQRWEVTAALMPKVDATELFVHTVLNGYDESFYIRMPQVYGRTPTTPGLSFSAALSAAAGDDTLMLNSSGSAKLAVGEFVRFSGHAKIYMIKESNLVAGPLNQVKVFPKLVKAVAATETTSYGGSVTMRVKYALDANLGISYSDGILARVDQATFIEDL